MVTDAQKKAFRDSLNNVFNGNIISKENTYQKTSQWFKQLYYRCKNGTLPEEHLKYLERRLGKHNLTIVDFLLTKGNIDKFTELHKEKGNKLEVRSSKIEHDIKEINSKIKKLEKEHTIKYKLLYNVSDKQFKETETQIELLKEKRRVLLKKRKIVELAIDNEEKSKKIHSLNECLVETENKNKQLHNKMDIMVQEEVKKITEINSKTKDSQKRIILSLLLGNNHVTLDEIKHSLDINGIPTNGLDISFNELKNEIPGIVRKIDTEGIKNYSICTSATNRKEALVESNICPKISNVWDGIVQFIVSSDKHLYPYIDLNKMKKELVPVFNTSSIYGDIPIIDIGDFFDSFKINGRGAWNNMNKEAIEGSYQFFKNYATAIQDECPSKVYQVFGNHDQHAYLVGVDPLEIINDYTDKLVFLGLDKSEIMIGNDKIGLFHGIESIPSNSGKNLNELLPFVREEILKIAKDYIYSLIGHYHYRMHVPNEGFSLLGSHGVCELLFTAVVEDGHVKSMCVEHLTLDNNKTHFKKDWYSLEVYNSDYQYRLKKSDE